MDLEQHIAIFTAFADSHLTGNKTNDYHIRLKRDHSLNVLSNGRAIINAEAIDGHLGELATLASLYHDIGRFPQFARFGTYKDADSVHHGRLGVQTLRSLSLPDDVATHEWRLIRAAVGLHNAKELNSKMTAPLRAVVDVVRDADKIDIFSVILEHLSLPESPQNVVIHSLEKHPTQYTLSVYEAALHGTPCDYKTLRFSNDFILLLIGWLFSLAYPSSIGMLHNHGLIDKAFSLLPQDSKITHLENKVKTLVFGTLAH